MSLHARTRMACAALALVLLGGCGGDVNLGGKGSVGSGGGSSGAPPVETAPDPSGSEPVTKFSKNFSLGTLAVAGDFLYFSSLGAKQAGELHRCRKSNCEATRELLTDVDGAIGSLQVFGDRLGVTNYADGSFWLGSYALPTATDPRIATADLPGNNAVSSQFIGDFVYFSLAVDRGIYRCALPDCPDGPQRIGSADAAPGQVDLCADGQLVFWTDRTFIYRAGDYGNEPARALLPDTELSAAPTSAPPPEGEPAKDIEALTAGGGALYAAVRDSETDPSCGPFCAQRMVRWPSGGGPREVLFSSEATLQRVFLFDGELVWAALPFQSADPYSATLSTCRVEACEATRRDLGKVLSNLHGVVADERDLYWLEAEVPAEAGALGSDFAQQIRRAPRLPPP
jgi:hypothetical protein